MDVLPINLPDLLQRLRMEDRYEAAIRLERARQIVREALRYGFVITRAHREEVAAAEAAYDHATAALQLCEG